MLTHSEQYGTLRYKSNQNYHNEDELMEKRTYTVPEAAVVLGIGRNAAYEAARTHQIPSIRIGKRILVPAAALDRLAAEGRSDHTPKESDLADPAADAT